MSKPIDQERKAFEAWYMRQFSTDTGRTLDAAELERLRGEEGNYRGYPSLRGKWECWQARASVQPAGGAVLEGYVLMPARCPSWLEDAYDAQCANDGLSGGLHLPAYEAMVSALAAAPHPVSEVARHALSAENQRVKPVEPMLAPRHPFDKPSLLKDCNVSYSNSSAHPVSGEQIPAKLDDSQFVDEFMKWWEDHGQYVRSGGGDYERTFAFQAWRHLMPTVFAYRALTAHRAQQGGAE